MVDGETDGLPSRHAIALSIDYTLKIAEIVTQGAQGDLVTAVVYLAISRANLRASFKDPRIARRHAGVAQAPADEARQPVSVLAISKDLELPYETTRRHVGKLVELELCRRAPDGGIVIPIEVAAGEASARGIEAIWRETLRYLNDLADLGVSREARRRRIAPDIRRITSRIAAYHVLDLLKLARTRVGLNAQAALLALAILRANALQAPDDGAPEAVVIVPETIRRPVTTHALALQMKMPYETVRRQVGWLEKAGICERRGRGLIIPTSIVRSRPELISALEGSWRETRAFLEALAELGLGAAEAARWRRRP